MKLVFISIIAAHVSWGYRYRNMSGDHQKKTVRLATRIPEVVGLAGNHYGMRLSLGRFQLVDQGIGQLMVQIGIEKVKGITFRDSRRLNHRQAVVELPVPWNQDDCQISSSESHSLPLIISWRVSSELPDIFDKSPSELPTSSHRIVYSLARCLSLILDP
ncbi:hypothetical protein BHE74_00006594 [Ensete ventricosum]|nr:hypothetical protein BHE74_00006594 [Ensete ventricosum]RZS08507.1 hypothetical protein BHM03_00039486 [Ensete ventricosum]